jgi:hypothetical protein
MLKTILDWMSDNPGLTVIIGIGIIIIIGMLR